MLLFCKFYSRISSFQGIPIGRTLRYWMSWVTLAVLSAGCNVAPPRLLHPGTAQYQQERAEQFDPYPLPELGPPTEARPRGFLLPQPDNERIQNLESFQDRYGQSPPPGIYRPPRSVPRNAVPIMTAPAYSPAPPVFVP